MSDTPFNVLISSAGRRVALLRLFQEALREAAVPGEVYSADISALSSAACLATRAFNVPRCTSEQFIPAISDICANNHISLIVPTIDTELPTYAAHVTRLANAGTTVCVSSPAAIEICGNKLETHRWLVEQGFPTVEQYELASLFAQPAAIKFPLLVKPIAGSSSIGVAVVRDIDELRHATRYRGAAAENSSKFVAQSIAEGHEFTIDIYVDRAGRCRCQIPRKRLEVRAGEVSKAVTVRDAALMRLATDIGERLPGAFGALCVQVFVAPDATMQVIEINARFGGGYPLSWAAGAHFPTWLIREVLGRADPCGAAPTLWHDGQVMLRYDDAVFTSAAAVGLQ